MEQRRITERNRLLGIIKDLSISNERDKKQLKLLLSNPNPILQSKLESQLENRKSQLDTLNYRLNNIKYGEFDDDINSQYISAQKKQHKEPPSKIPLTPIKKKSHNTSSQQQSEAKEWKSSYSHFKRTCETVPDYIVKNLSTMPANKGYIWRDVIFFGNKPVDNSLRMTILFEKQPDSSLNIHEWTRDNIRIYNKNGNVKTLISHTKRR